MNYLKINFISLLIFSISIMSCRGESIRISRIEYSIPDHIIIKTEDLKTALKDINTDPSGDHYLVLVIYSYSSGKETISYSGIGDLKTTSGKGRLKVLLKFMNDTKIIRAEFIVSEGNSKEEIISSIAKEIKLKLDN